MHHARVSEHAEPPCKKLAGSRVTPVASMAADCMRWYTAQGPAQG